MSFKLSATGYLTQDAALADAHFMTHIGREGVDIDALKVAVEQVPDVAAVELNGIGWAVKQLGAGLRVTRPGWNGKGMYLELQVPDANSKMSLPYVYMRTADGHLVPWLASQTDLLATDWLTVPA